MDRQSVAAAVASSPPGVALQLSFTAKGNDGQMYHMLPLNRVVDQRYTAHLNVSVSATQCLCGGADSCSSGAGATPAGTKLLSFTSESLLAVGGAVLEGTILRSGNPRQTTAVVMKHPFAGPGTITGIKLSYRYTIGYNNAPGKNGAQIRVQFHPSLDLGGCGSPLSADDPNAKTLYTSPAYLQPEYDKTHAYSPPINVSLSGLSLDVSQPGARLGIQFMDNDHNMQLILPIDVEIAWKEADGHHHH